MEENPTSSPTRNARSANTFEGVVFHIATSFPPERIAQLEAALLKYAGRKANSLEDDDLNVVIVDGPRWEGWHIIADKVHEEQGQQELGNLSAANSKNGRKIDVVTDNWVERSIVLNRLQSAHFFSPDPALLFSGVVASATNLPSSDLETLSGGITALGGQWRVGLTQDLTHLFAISPGSPKYEAALSYKEETGIKILLPHWFDDVIRLGSRKLPTTEYEWPEARILNQKNGAPAPVKEETQAERDQALFKKSMFATAALLTPAMNASSPQPPADLSQTLRGTLLLPGGSDAYMLPKMWNGRRILLSRTLQLFGSRRTAVEASIVRAGGKVVKFTGDEDVEEPEEVYDEEVEDESQPDGKRVQKLARLARNERRRRRAEAEAVPQCDVLVTRWRYGRAYVEAVRAHKMIGTMAWLYQVQATGVLAHPVNQLLHYPVPKRPIDGFANHVITVTNYTGEAREYLKKLINVMGATFTASMSTQNTVLIAANTQGTKAVKAHAWSIAVVNHTWLEDCFIQWRNLTCALEKYIVFPPGVDFSAILGERGVWVGADTNVPDNNTSQEDGQVFRRTRDRLEVEAEELADVDEIMSDLEQDGDVGDLESVAALLEPPTLSAKVEEVQPDKVQGGLAAGSELGGAMDVDVDPHANDWELPVFDEEPAAEVHKTPKQKNSGGNKPTPKQTSRKDKIDKKGGGGASRKEDKDVEPRKMNDVLELNDSSVEEMNTPVNSKEKTSSTKVDPTKKPKAGPSSNPRASGSKVREASELTSPSQDIVAPRSKPRPRVAAEGPPTPQRFEAQEEEESSGDDEETFPAHILPLSSAKGKGPQTLKSKSRSRLPASSDEDVDMEAHNTGSPKKKVPTPDEEESDSAIVVPQPKPKSTKAATTPAKSAAVANDKNGIATAGSSSAARPGLLSRPKVDARTRVKKKKVVEVEIESEEEVEQAPVISAKGKGKGKQPGKSESAGKGGQKGKKVVDTSSGEEDEIIDRTKASKKPSASVTKDKVQAPVKEVTTYSRKKPLKAYSMSPSPESEDKDEEPPSSHLITKSATRQKARSGGRQVAARSTKSPFEEGNDEDDDRQIANPGPPSKSKALKQTREKPPDTESPSEEDHELPTKPEGKATSKRQPTTSRPKATPKRVVSVLLPSLQHSPAKNLSKKIPNHAKDLVSSEMEEDEPAGIVLKGAKGKAPVKISGKRPNDATVKAPAKGKPKSKRAPTPSEEDIEEEEEEVSVLVSPRTRAMARTDSIRAISGQSSVGPGATKGRGGKLTNEKLASMDVDEPVPGPSSLPRRSAAAKASQKLRDTIMPDVISFEQQMRKATKARRSSGRVGMDSFVVEGEDTSSASGAQKRGGANDGEEEVANRKKKRRISEPDDSAGAKLSAKAQAVDKDKSVPMDVDLEAPTVRIMTTQVTLGDDVIKGLKKLGAEVTTRPSECTHLLARQVVRTEKFLCALASAQWILSEKWAVASIDAKRLLPEKQFVLKDKEGEKKYHVDLSQALRRAREYEGKMLEGHTFYVTPKVQVDIKLLKNVVNACGGVLSAQTPTVRIINSAPDKRHVISCKEDVSIWRPLAQQGIKVYNQELLLGGILRQDIQWDDEDLIVQL